MRTYTHLRYVALTDRVLCQERFAVEREIRGLSNTKITKFRYIFGRYRL
jgi:hypothetical protein